LSVAIRVISFHSDFPCEDIDECPDMLDRHKWTIVVIEDPCKKDSDNDGISDCDDGCLHEKEMYNGYQDDDGCPDTPPSSTLPPEIPNEMKMQLAYMYAPTLYKGLKAVTFQAYPTCIAQSAATFTAVSLGHPADV